MRIAAALTALIITASAAADPPCRVVHQPSAIVVPQKVLSNHAIHAATIYHDTHLQIVEVPVPALVFQQFNASVYAPVTAVAQPVAQAPPADQGIGTDADLASLVQPLNDPAGEIKQKCASCHSASANKGGLSLFNESGAFYPTSKKSTLTRANLAARARSTDADVMPPGANEKPEKRLSEAAIAYLENGR